MREVVPQIDPDEVRQAEPAKPVVDAPTRVVKSPEVKINPDARQGPGPSKLAYRLSRAWAKPVLRNAVLVYLPLIVLTIVGWRIAAHDGLRGTIEAKFVSLVERVAARPEFAVRGVTVTGGSDELNAEVRRTLEIQRGASSLNLDVEQLRLRTEELGAVETATVQFDPQGTLRVTVVERVAVALFRRPDKVLVMLDMGGVEIGPAISRANHPDLPVIVGAGGRDRVGEVIDLLAAAPDIVPRLRAFVRIGERRWDIVLDREMRIMLPQARSVDAMSFIMALHYSEELLDRDLSVIDMRLPDRPALRMKVEAAETYQIRRAVAALGGEDT